MGDAEMALISCPECSREISDSAKACPHCGYPLVEVLKKENSISTKENIKINKTGVTGNAFRTTADKITGIILVLLLFGLIYGISSCAESCGNSTPSNATGLPADPKDMTNKQYQQYKEWEAKQDQKQWEDSKAFQ